MSFQAINWAFEAELPCPEKMVLIVLANYSNHVHESHPSQSTIARNGGLSRPAVNKILARLERDGWVTIVPRAHDTGADRSYSYLLNVPEVSTSWPHVFGTPNPGFVYVAETDALRKVGISRRLDGRMKGLSAQAGMEVRLVQAFPMDMKSARLVEEMTLHALKDVREKGEWVSCSAERAVEAVNQAIREGGVILGHTPPVSDEHTPCNPGTHPGVILGHTLNLQLTKEEEPSRGSARDLEGHAPAPDIGKMMKELAESLRARR